MNCRESGTLHVCASAVVLLSVVAFSAMWRTEFEDDSLTNWLIAIFTGLSVLVGIGGIYWIRKTLLVNQDMVGVTSRALEYDIWRTFSGCRPRFTPQKVSVFQSLDDGTVVLSIDIANTGSFGGDGFGIATKIGEASPVSFLQFDRDLNEALRDISMASHSPINFTILGGGTHKLTHTVDKGQWLDDGAEAQKILVSIIYKSEYNANSYKCFQTVFAVYLKNSDMEEHDLRTIEGTHVMSYRQQTFPVDPENIHDNPLD